MGNCNKCNEAKTVNTVIKDPCGCKEPELCGCDQKYDLLCSIYTGEFLEKLNIQPGTDGNTVIKIINDYIENVLSTWEKDPTVIENVGNGVGVFKEFAEGYKNLLRTIKGVGVNVGVSESGDEIIIRGPSSVNIGHGVAILREFTNGNDNQFRTVKGEEGVDVNLSTTGSEVKFSVSKEWVSDYFKEQWFIELLKSIFNSEVFKNFFANYITNLITDNYIDICALIEDCSVEHEDTPPVITGDVVYNLNNRVQNYALSSEDFLSKYSDADGDQMKYIKIIGGDTTGVTKTISGNTTPLSIGDIVLVSDIPNIKFTAISQDSAYSQTILYIAIASNGGESN